MLETALSGRDAILVGIPVLAVMIVNYFHLDGVFTARSRPESPHRRFPGLDADGEPLLCDPDGLRWR